jgi:D-alanine-D-alanine ligase
MNIVVLAGGISMERDVSLSSGVKISQALRRGGHRTILVDLFFGLEALPDPVESAFSDALEDVSVSVPETAPDIDAIRRQRGESLLGEVGPNVIEICKAADMVYMGLHGESGENGKLQALFDVAGVRYTGSGQLGSALAMHKWISKEILVGAGVLTPAWQMVRPGEVSVCQVGFPCVVKPCSGGSSIGVSIAQDAAEYDAALKEAFRYEDEVMVEQYIKGREFSVGVLDGKALPIIEIIPKEGFYDYANKYQAGRTLEICPAELDEETACAMQREAEKIFQLLRLSVYARMDFMLDEKTGKFYCLEGNTLPGMTPTSLIPQMAAAAGISYEALCDRVISLSLKKYR